MKLTIESVAKATRQSQEEVRVRLRADGSSLKKLLVEGLDRQLQALVHARDFAEVVCWNDQPHRTHAEAIGAFERAMAITALLGSSASADVLRLLHSAQALVIQGWTRSAFEREGAWCVLGALAEAIRRSPDLAGHKVAAIDALVLTVGAGSTWSRTSWDDRETKVFSDFDRLINEGRQAVADATYGGE